jgi:predicted metal-dependent hydrolase
VRSFTYGSHVIPYTLEYVQRKTLGITVQPDLSVRVRAPIDADQKRVEQVLKRRAAWIVRQQRFFSQFLPRTPARQYRSGETHLYLGRKYRLRVQERSDEGAKLLGGYLYVYVGDPTNQDRIRTLLERWYRARAEMQFQVRLGECMNSSLGRDLPMPRLRIRRMVCRWGSCSPSGTLSLNLDLIRAPRACIDYVITHELCHLRHRNHSPEFYRLLSSMMPDWQERKLRLEKMLA